jgi:dihydroflavonol-4-reductase
MNLRSSIPYERTKAMSEEMVRASARQNGLDMVVVNPTAVIGPHDFRPSFLGQFLLRLHAGRIPGMVHGGYNFVDARDVARGSVEAALKGRSGERYLLPGHYVDLPQLVDLIGEVLGKDLRLPMLNDTLAHIGIPFIRAWAWLRKEDPLYTRESLKILRTSNTLVSCEKALKELSYQPRPLIETLKDTYSWFRQQQYL